MAHGKDVDSNGLPEESATTMCVIREIQGTLGLHDLGQLGASSSRNQARLVGKGEEQFVLKLTTVPMGNEVGALIAWQNVGLAGAVTPKVHEYGVTSEHGWPWSLQQHFRGTSPVRLPEGPRLSGVLALAERLYQAEIPPGTPLLKPILFDRLKRLTITNSFVGEAVYKAQDALLGLEGDLGLVHGDFIPSNLIQDGDMLRVIDPFGLCAPAAYDAARFLSRNTARCPLAPQLPGIAVESGLELGQLAILVAVELLDAAYGARHSAHPSPQAIRALVNDAVAVLDLLT